jgi:hypothetical protein
MALNCWPCVRSCDALVARQAIQHSTWQDTNRLVHLVATLCVIIGAVDIRCPSTRTTCLPVGDEAYQSAGRPEVAIYLSLMDYKSQCSPQCARRSFGPQSYQCRNGQPTIPSDGPRSARHLQTRWPPLPRGLPGPGKAQSRRHPSMASNRRQVNSVTAPTSRRFRP